MVRDKKRALGRGMDALIPTNREAPPPATTPDETRILFLDPQGIAPNPKQPRKAFHEEALQELAASIQRNGIQEPVIVRQTADGYELVTGERRVRAAIMAGLVTIPAICRPVSDSDMLKLGLIENIQREDLNPIELAQGYQALIEEFQYTQEQLADEVGKKRATVANTLRLLHLPPDLQRCVVEGELTMGHARALLAIATADGQRAAARRVIALGLSVREAEKLAAPPAAKTKRNEPRDPNLVQIEDELRGRFGVKVLVKNRKNNRGRIEIEYYGLDDFDRVLALLRAR